MQRNFFRTFAIGCFALSISFPLFAQETSETPIGPKWWPSEWGATDQRGAANRLTAQKVLEARELIREGSAGERRQQQAGGTSSACPWSASGTSV